MNLKRQKNALKTDRTLLWAWQMVFPIATDLKKRASWLCSINSNRKISRQTIYDLQSSLSAELENNYFGSTTTLMATDIGPYREAKNRTFYVRIAIY